MICGLAAIAICLVAVNLFADPGRWVRLVALAADSMVWRWRIPVAIDTSLEC